MKKFLSLTAMAAMAVMAQGASAGSPPQAGGITPVHSPGKIYKEIFPAPAQVRVAASHKAKARVQPSDFMNRSFSGALISAESWMDMWITEVPYGIYDFTLSSDGITRSERYTGMSQDWMSGAVKRNRFYGIRNVNMFGSLTGVVFSEVDLAANESVREVFADEPSFGLLPSAMAYDYASGDIYGVFYNSDLTGYNWSRFNTKTLEQEVICQFNGRFNPVAMASAPDGLLYVVNTDGDLYTVNRTNSRVSLVGHTGVNVAAYTQAMTWDSATNTFLWMAVTPTGPALYSLDPEGPVSTLVQRGADGEQLAAIFFDTAERMDGTPAAPVSLKWNFSAPGAFDGTVTLQCPDAGELTVYLDGEPVKEAVSVTAGSNITIPFSGLSNATHHVSAMMHNATGWSPVAESFQYAGYDVPLPVTGLTFSESGGVASLSWNAPAGGVEGGYIDPSALYYKIYRLPDGVEVASHHTSTTFSETLPSGVKRYSYRVVPFNGDARQGEAVVSNALVYGESYELPFRDDFAMEGALDVYTLIDGDGDGQNWGLSGVYLSSNTIYDADKDVTDNWILSPKMKLETGKLYRVTLHMRNMWGGNPDMMAVGYTLGDTRESIIVAGELEVNTPSMTLLDHNVDFYVPSAGDYKIALGFITPRGSGGGVFIDNFEVREVGALTAPAAVSGLTVTPDAGRAPEATLDFTAPSEAIDGSALSGMLTAVIYRDGDRIGEKPGISAGAQVEWTDDTEPAPGNHIYTVRMSNGDGEGMDASAAAFVGVYTAPFNDPLDTREAVSYYTYLTSGFTDPELNSEMTFPSYGDPCLEVDHMNFTDEHHEMWIVFPMLRLDEETVYTISYEMKKMSWGDGLSVELVMGNSPEPEALSVKLSDVNLPQGYDFEKDENLMVFTGDAGFKYLAFHITAPTQGYLYIYLRNISIERAGSSKAPDVVTDLVATSDLTSRLSMKAPATDYAGRPLAELEKVEVFRNGSVLPVHTFTNPAPGQELEWIDDNAILGTNSYFIVPSNSYGRGNAVTVKSFIGYDEPVAPEGLSILPSPDNQTATVTWERPRRGVNGGVLNDEEMTFVLVRYYPDRTDETKRLEVLRTGITGTSVVPDRTPTDAQELVYYGIATSTPQGMSAPSLYFTILGRPYAFPFHESFAAGEAASSLWLNAGSSSYGLQAMPTSDEVLAYNGFTGESQDGDRGVFMFLNGAMSENPIPFAVLSPKISLEGAVDPVLSLWLYKGNQCGGYATVPQLNISASTDEDNFIELGNEKWDEPSPRWVECTYPLGSFTGNPGAIIFRFVATAGGMADIMLMDNFRVDEAASIAGVASDGSELNAFGMTGGILTRGACGLEVKAYTPVGILAAAWTGDDTVRPMAPGIYLVTFGGRTFSVRVR